MMPSAQHTVTARWIIPMDGPPLRHGTISIQGGIITAVEPHGKHAADEDLGNCAILPGFVNAHTHLDLSGLRNLATPSPDFTSWLRTVVHHRRLRSPEDVDRDIRAGIAECLAHGTTLVGDISTGGASWPALSESPLRAVVFFELLGLPRDRARGAWALARDWLRLHPATATCRPGLSPHAPYSVRRTVLRLALREAKTHSTPLAIHLAETLAELELLKLHRGPFVDFLVELGVFDPDGLAGSTDEVIHLTRKAGNTLLVHGNYLSPAQLSPADTVVYCPRTHAAFGHPPYPLREFLAAGARVALGTDSLASNPDLSVLEEARFVHRCFSEIPPRDVLRMATLDGASALGWSDVTGSLAPGKFADLVVMPLPKEKGDPCEQVLASSGHADSGFAARYRLP